MKKLSKPADVLLSYLNEYQITISQLAKEIKLSQSIVRQLTMGKAKISLNTAARLAKYFGTTIQFWMDLQSAFDLAELKNDAALNDILKGIVKAKKPKNPPPKAEKAEKPAVKKGRAQKEQTADAPIPAPAKRGRKAAAVAVAADSAPKTRGRKPAEAKAAEEPAKPGRKPRAKKEETASAAVTAKAEPKKRGRKPKAKPAEEPELQKVFKPRVELIKKKDLEKPAEEFRTDYSASDEPAFSSDADSDSQTSSDQGQPNNFDFFSHSGDDENHDDSGNL
jgi:addiction module HigA family antidote